MRALHGTLRRSKDADCCGPSIATLHVLGGGVQAIGHRRDTCNDTHNIQSIHMITVWNSSVPRDRCALRTGAPDDLTSKTFKRSDDCSADCASIDRFSLVTTAVPNKRVIKTGSSLYPLVHRFERNKPDTSLPQLSTFSWLESHLIVDTDGNDIIEHLSENSMYTYSSTASCLSRLATAATQPR